MMKTRKRILALTLMTALTACSASEKEEIYLVDTASPDEVAAIGQSPRGVAVTEQSGGYAKVKMIKQSRMAGMVPALAMENGAIGFGTVTGEWNRESYDGMRENGFINCLNDSLSTFSIDVDTASYANVRRFVNDGILPPIGAVRIEEMINYFSYDFPRVGDGEPMAMAAEVGPSPFTAGYRLVKVGLKAKELDAKALPPSNLVFLVDVSGSMQARNKLPLLKESMKLLVSKLSSRDRVSIVAYAGAERIVLQPIGADQKERIYTAIDSLASGGSTHASKGIYTAYELAKSSFMPMGNNRVILASDGDFNVGITSRGELQKLVEEKRTDGVYLTVLGFGMGNYHDDTMEILADKGNGNYAYIDSLLEANKVLGKEMSGTLFAVADDVKIQVEFNPAQVGAYRLIGYENRVLADEDFKDDKKDAGEMGVGHTVTALYEIIPAGHPDVPDVDKLKYQLPEKMQTASSKELMTIKLRYKRTGTAVSEELSEVAVTDNGSQYRNSDDFRFAAAVAGYGMLLKKSDHLGKFTWESCLALIKNAKGNDPEGYRAEFLRIVEMSMLLDKKG